MAQGLLNLLSDAFDAGWMADFVGLSSKPLQAYKKIKFQ